MAEPTATERRAATLRERARDSPSDVAERLDELTEILSEPSVSARRDAAQAIARVSQHAPRRAMSVAYQVTAAVQDRDHRVVLFALRAATYLAAKDSSPFVNGARVFVDRLLNADEVEIRERAGAVVTALADASPDCLVPYRYELADALIEPTDAVRAHAVWVWISLLEDGAVDFCEPHATRLRNLRNDSSLPPPVRKRLHGYLDSAVDRTGARTAADGSDTRVYSGKGSKEHGCSDDKSETRVFSTGGSGTRIFESTSNGDYCSGCGADLVHLVNPQFCPTCGNELG